MEAVWYYVVGGTRHGPVTFDELCAKAAAGAFGPDALVWQPAFDSEWRKAGDVEGLFEKKAPPAPPPRQQEFAEWATAPSSALTGVGGARPSCLAAASQAFDRMVLLLFRPFNIERWFSIGFCAWLAYLGTQSGGGNFKNDLKGKLNDGSPESFKQFVDKGLDSHFALSLDVAEWAVVAGAVAVVLLFAFLFCWIRSRGDFMFLHRWYAPNAPIGQCWASSRSVGRELFAWRVYFCLISVLLFVLIVVAAYVTVVQPYMAAGKEWGDALTRAAIGCGTAAVLLSLAVQCVAHLTKAFVVPVMYWHGVSASRAWLSVFSLCNQYPFAVLGYLLCGIGCWIAAVFAILAVVLLTCCLAAIPLILPYISAVAMLPVSFFFRGYSVCFLSQWRPELVPETKGRF